MIENHKAGDAVNTAPLSETSLFSIPIRVYYEDTDAGGVVYHSNYINYFERARTEWLRHLGFEQDVLINEHQVVFVVKSLNCDYLKPALFNDELFVSASIREIGKTHITFTQKVTRVSGDEFIVLAEGNVIVVCVDTLKFKPKRLPNFLLESINNV